MHKTTHKKTDMDLPTPSLAHLSAADFKQVYEPAEDTFLFLDALERDQEDLRSMEAILSLEIGSGSGTVLSFLGRILGANSGVFLATDINSFATNVTQRTGMQNGVFIDVINTSLVQGLDARLTGNVDVLLFNPPYVPTESDEVGVRDISAAWAGGLNGREVLDLLLPVVGKLLSAQGVFYLVVVKENRPDEICDILLKQGLIATTVLERRSGRERLSILRFNKS